jgi:SAM-dependent methyltransferase
MGVEWYDMIARRNGGYKNNAVFTVEGISGEQIFEEELVRILPKHESVLDAGCGHGEFTMKMARYAKSIIGFDNSIEMINIANSILQETEITNTQFVYATTKQELPYADGQFDLIYTRRGPTSILNHPKILRSGGTILGIHSGALETVKARLEDNGFTNIKIQEYNDAFIYFPNEKEFAKFISGIPGNPDFTSDELKNELERKINESIINGRIGLKEYKYIWKAIKP